MIKELETQIGTIESMILYNKDFYPKQDVTSLENRMETAKESLKAIKKDVAVDIGGDDETYVCPHCGFILDNKVISDVQYCYNCGQKLNVGGMK